MPATSRPILIGIGANLPTARFGPPRTACEAAVQAIDETDDIRVMAKSRWFESAPVPMSDQPWYVNGVIRVETGLSPDRLLAALHRIEADFGRVRAERNAPRVLDLDLLAYGGVVAKEEGGIEIPHPRLAGRAFVLLPLQDIAPDWVHPKSGLSLKDMLAVLPDGQICRPLD